MRKQSGIATQFSMQATVALLLGGLAANAVAGGAPTTPAVAVAAVAGVAAQIYVYPAAGQNAEQLDRDRFECHDWAVKQTGFDPSLPPAPPREQVVAVPPNGVNTVAGGANGALIGAVVSRPREAGKGALIGGVVGALLGKHADEANERHAEAAQQQLNRDAQARLNESAGEYRRAITACLDARGYTVK